MKTWQIAPRRLMCGGPCAGWIEEGKPIAVIESDRITRRVRGECCAGPANWEQIAAWGQRMDARAEAADRNFVGLRDLAPRFDARAAAAGKDPE